jgi:hypothetical protein
VTRRASRQTVGGLASPGPRLDDNASRRTLRKGLVRRRQLGLD